MGICESLALILIVLKLTDHPEWSWLFVTAPIWLGYGVAVGLYCLATSGETR